MELEEKERLGWERMSWEGPALVDGSWPCPWSVVAVPGCHQAVLVGGEAVQGFGTGHSDVSVPMPRPCSVPLMTSRQLNWN